VKTPLDKVAAAVSAFNTAHGAVEPGQVLIGYELRFGKLDELVHVSLRGAKFTLLTKDGKPGLISLVGVRAACGVPLEVDDATKSIHPKHGLPGGSALVGGVEGEPEMYRAETVIQGASLSEQLGQRAAEVVMPPEPVAGVLKPADIMNPLGAVTKTVEQIVKDAPEAIKAYNSANTWQDGLRAAATVLGRGLIGDTALDWITRTFKGFCEEVAKADPSTVITLAITITLVMGENKNETFNSAEFDTIDDAVSLWAALDEVSAKYGDMSVTVSPWAGTASMWDMRTVAGVTGPCPWVAFYAGRVPLSGGTGTVSPSLSDVLAEWQAGAKSLSQMFRANQGGTDTTSGFFATKILRTLCNKIKGYDLWFTDLWLKYILMCNASVPSPGETRVYTNNQGFTQSLIDAHVRVADPASARDVGGVIAYWPFTPAANFTRPALNAWFVPMNRFNSMILGADAGPDARVLPSTWGKTTAVVPVSADLAQCGIIGLWTLLHMGYPYVQSVWSGTRRYTRASTDGADWTAQAATYLAQWPISVQGPRDNVLFVPVDSGQAGFELNYDLTITGPSGGSTAVVMSTAGVAGAADISNRLDNWSNGASTFDRMPLVASYLQQFYTTKGFVEAMMVAASEVRRLNPTITSVPYLDAANGNAIVQCQAGIANWTGGGWAPEASTLKGAPVIVGASPTIDVTTSPSGVTDVFSMNMLMMAQPKIAMNRPYLTGVRPKCNYVNSCPAYERVLLAASYISAGESSQLPNYTASTGSLVRQLHLMSLHIVSYMSRALTVCPTAGTENLDDDWMVRNPLHLWYGSSRDTANAGAHVSQVVQNFRLLHVHLAQTITTSSCTFNAIDVNTLNVLCSTMTRGILAGNTYPKYIAMNLCMDSLVPAHLHQLTTGGVWINEQLWSTKNMVFVGKVKPEWAASADPVLGGATKTQRSVRQACPSLTDAAQIFKADHNADWQCSELFWNTWQMQTYLYNASACRMLTIASTSLARVSTSLDYEWCDAAYTGAARPAIARNVSSLPSLPSVCQINDFASVVVAAVATNFDITDGWRPVQLKLARNRQNNPIDGDVTPQRIVFAPANSIVLKQKANE